MKNIECEANEEAYANTGANINTAALGQSSNELTGVKEEILTVIKILKYYFSIQLACRGNKELADYKERITQVELRVTTIEDEHVELWELVQHFKGRNKVLYWKIK